MAFTAIESTRVTAELAVVLAEAMPATKAAFLDHTNTYADNLTALNTVVAAVTAILFNTTAPTVLP